MAGLYETQVAFDFAFRESFALSIAVLVNSEPSAEVVHLQRGHDPDEDDFGRRTLPPLIHSRVPFAAGIGAREGQRMQFAIRHTAPEPLSFIGAGGGPFQCAIRWLSNGEDWR